MGTWQLVGLATGLLAVLAIATVLNRHEPYQQAPQLTIGRLGITRDVRRRLDAAYASRTINFSV